MARNWVPESVAHLDLKKVEKVFIACNCSVPVAARRLRVPAADLRRLVAWGGLADLAVERLEQTIDKAQQTLREGLESPNMADRLMAAKALVTLTDAGRRRGFGRGGTVRSSQNTIDAKAVELRWDDGGFGKRSAGEP